MAINIVAISGNLTKDPELRQTASGTAVISLSVAVNERRKNNQTGEWDDYPNYIDCTMFGTRAAKIADMLGKGCKVAIQGKMRQERWQKDGKNYSKIAVIVDEIEFISQSQKPKQKPQDEYDGYYPSDIPF